jgi:RNA recognition motif-containing protein
MRICLFHLFSTYGEVLQVRMRQTQQLRGQAFVVFRDQINADLAKHQLAAFNVYGN